ncbi:hypothetical protein HPP92_011429 [Vanilla planifolia]|uniref:Pentatricopeptide repeat-containing protein n=1 Tax=Vanilla planifolia TaxID=51239 RepID=A0A835R0K4_VANPL|nr:hypothetical protein HPP92_011429 [Vanilla planifolia]
MRLYMVAMDMHHEMHASGVNITIVTIAVILPVCAKLKFLEYGQSLHAYILKMGMELETLVGNALVSFYSKCGRVLDDAWIVFDMIPYKDVISWNSLIAGLSENGYISEALNLFYQMFQMDVMPNDATIVSILPICSLLENGWLYGKEIHGYALRSEFDKDLSVCNALMIHYLKVGDVTGAEYLFQKMKRRDLVTWNTLISGYAMNGWLSEAMIMFHNLFKSGMEPDSVTFISILPCCAQLLDLEEGKKIHSYILGHDFLSQNTLLGNALVNFYGKCGKLDKAFLCFEG